MMPYGFYPYPPQMGWPIPYVPPILQHPPPLPPLARLTSPLDNVSVNSNRQQFSTSSRLSAMGTSNETGISSKSRNSLQDLRRTRLGGHQRGSRNRSKYGEDEKENLSDENDRKRNVAVGIRKNGMTMYERLQSRNERVLTHLLRVRQKASSPERSAHNSVIKDMRLTII